MTAARVWDGMIQLAACAVLALATAGLVLGYVGAYVPAVVVPVVALETGALWWLWRRIHPDSFNADDSGWALLVGGVGIVAITAFHALHSGSFLFVTRDPAFYNLLGLELARDGDLTFGEMPEAFRSITGLRFQAYGMHYEGGTTYVQGFHATEAVLAPSAWIGGTWLYLKSSAVLGGVCLLVFRRLAARLTSPWVATALALALGLSLPFAVFSRDTYSEILALFCVVAGLLVLVEGRFGPGRIFLAMLFAGAAVGARIDSLLVVTGFAIGVALYPLVAEQRWLRAKEFGALVVGTAVPTGLGLAIGLASSPGYVRNLRGSIRAQFLVCAALIVLTLVVYLVWAVCRRWRVNLSALRSPRFVTAATVVVIGAGLMYWLVLPSVFEWHQSKPFAGMGALQEREGIPTDPTRTFGEDSLVRLGWTYGSLTVLAAIAGCGLAVGRVLGRRDPVVWFVLAVGLTSAPYLVIPKITPDMPWALRRFLPVVIPIMLLLAGLALDWLRAALRDRAVPVMAVVLVTLVGGAAVTLSPVARSRTDLHARAFADDVCRATPDDAFILVTHPTIGPTSVQTFELFCETDVAALRADAPETVVDDTVRRAVDEGRQLVLVVGPGQQLPTGLVESSRIEVRYASGRIRPTLEHAPNGRQPTSYDADVVLVVSG